MTTIFDSLKPEKTISLSKDEYIFRQGDTVTHIYLIIDGQIRMLRNSLEGKSSIMYEGSKGETFAEASLFSAVYHCDAVAQKESRVYGYNKTEILKLFEQQPSLSMAYTAMLAQQVQKLRMHLELRNINNAQQRIYQFLVLNANDKGQVILNASLKDVALKLGLAHETFYRSLKAMEQDKLISRNASSDIFITNI